MGMAVDPDTVALDEAEAGMSAPVLANAAIWFSPDGFDPSRGVNGRRMAGDSFLRGWIRHAAISECLALTYGPSDGQAFRDLVASIRPDLPVRIERLDDARAIAPVGTMFFSGPNFATEAWRRSLWGETAYSICGLTHTMSTKAVMEGAFHLRTGPQAEWDAVICTSRAVRSALSTQLDLIDDFLSRRFGPDLPPRPQLPVIPLGINCDEFRRDPALGAALRQELGIAPEDSVALVVARLSPHEKFDPLPVYIALQRARQGARRNLHLILYGNFPDDYSRRVFLSTAGRFMPDVGLHHVAHAGPERRLAALSAAEMFLFPIDNLQESFGIAPVEAMAAGLPVVAADWDGIRDTVDDAAGFLVPSTGARAEHVTATGLRYHGGTDSYIQYLGQVSAVTALDVGRMSVAVRSLMDSPDLRNRMGMAGQERARHLFDWSVIVPSMQALFAELDARRQAADTARHPRIAAWALPVAPSPMTIFSAFPTRQLAPGATFAWQGSANLSVSEAFALRDYVTTRRLFETAEHVQAVANALALRNRATAAELAQMLDSPLLRVERCLLWLMKYGFAALEEDPAWPGP